jgi:hypothetical protein
MKTLLIALLSFVPFQSAAAGMAGVWVAEHRGTTFIRLELSATGNTVTGGAMGTGNLKVDDKGVVIEVSAVPTTLTPVRQATVNGDTLSFVRAEGNDLEQFRLRILGADQAELTLVPTEEMLEEIKEAGIAVPRPFRLRKIR